MQWFKGLIERVDLRWRGVFLVIVNIFVTSLKYITFWDLCSLISCMLPHGIYQTILRALPVQAVAVLPYLWLKYLNYLKLGEQDNHAVSRYEITRAIHEAVEGAFHL